METDCCGDSLKALCWYGERKKLFSKAAGKTDHSSSILDSKEEDDFGPLLKVADATGSSYFSHSCTLLIRNHAALEALTPKMVVRFGALGNPFSYKHVTSTHFPPFFFCLTCHRYCRQRSACMTIKSLSKDSTLTSSYRAFPCC